MLCADRKLNLYSCSRLSKVRELTHRGIGTGGGMGQGPKFSGNTKTAFSPVAKCPFAFVKKCYSDYIFYDCNYFSLSPWPTFPWEIFQVPFSFQKCPSKPPPPNLLMLSTPLLTERSSANSRSVKTSCSFLVNAPTIC